MIMVTHSTLWGCDATFVILFLFCFQTVFVFEMSDDDQQCNQKHPHLNASGAAAVHTLYLCTA